MITLTTFAAVSFNIAANAQVAAQWAIGLTVVVFGFQGILWVISRVIRFLTS